ncbi:MAG TPA: HNH endonuclease signature motif containing protein [Mycobacteriales bacterium]|nr:HNH endonuclease signature motif containing protein [Mycobacteriales bacterium]
MPRPPLGRASKVSDEQLLAAAAEAVHMRDLLLRLGIVADGGNYESVRWRLQRLGALEARFDRRLARRDRGASLRDDHTYSDEQLTAAVAAASTKADVLRALGLAPSPQQYPELNRRLAAASVDTAHLRGRAWRRGGTYSPRVPLEVVLARPRAPARLGERLVREGLVERRCAECGREEWNGKPIPLELDHVNGDRPDNRLENLRLLCPNCHAQTPTWRGRNIGRGMQAFATPAGVLPVQD